MCWSRMQRTVSEALMSDFQSQEATSYAGQGFSTSRPGGSLVTGFCRMLSSILDLPHRMPPLPSASHDIAKYPLGNKATLSETLHRRQHCQSKAMVSNRSRDTPRESCGISRGNPLLLDLGMSVAARPALTTLKCRHGPQQPWVCLQLLSINRNCGLG